MKKIVFAAMITAVTLGICACTKEVQREYELVQTTEAVSEEIPEQTQRASLEEESTQPETVRILETETEEIPEESTSEAASVENTMQEVKKIFQESDSVGSLQAAKNLNQLIVVAVEQGKAVLSMHERKEDDAWECILSEQAEIGKNGIGKTKEGDKKTPTGFYTLSFAFGIQDNPGTALPYTKADDTYYWVDDAASAYYNRFVSTREVAADWSSAEHIVEAVKPYAYAIAVDYNTECIPGQGSAIFLHCKPTGGAGCIAVSQDRMITILQRIQPGCAILIEERDKISSY